jgi:DNA-binding response OmpR family regulator
MPKILIIDDDTMVRDTLARILKRKGYDVLAAEDGRRGLVMFEKEQPDLAIIDIIMPEKEGIETIREICRLSPQAKIIAISGGARFGNVDFLSMAAKFGASEVFAKPFDPDALLDSVAQCLRTPPPEPDVARPKPPATAA